MKNKKNNIAKNIFELMEEKNCRQIIFHYDSKNKLKAILVIDSLPGKRDKNGKLSKKISASGGIRFAHKDPDDALFDALNLAHAMTRKANVLGVDEGGCKAVVLANQNKNKSILYAIGDFIQIQKGLFKTAIDLGFKMKDAEIIASKTDYIDSLAKKGLGSTGENTAEGMIYGFEIISQEILKKQLSECSVAIQGLGGVGFALAKRLINKKCKVLGSDVIKENCEKAEKIGVKIVSPEKILFQKVDILSPCAFGGVINQKNIPKLKCKIIAGGANNPLKNELEDEKRLLNKGIIYIPDFILNCGGFLQALVERSGGTLESARKKSIIVKKRIKEIINYSRKNKTTLLESAIMLFDKK